MLVATIAVGISADRCWAQAFGAQPQANAASQMILLGVTQGINSLPPPNAQSFTYEYDSALDTYVASPDLGPAIFRTPRTVGAGKLSFRAAASYFELSDDLGTIPYSVKNFPGQPQLFTRLGLQVAAKVGLFNFGVGYGVTDKLEIAVNVPVSVVDASALKTGSYIAGTNQVAAAPTLAGLDQALANGDAVIDKLPFSAFSDPVSGSTTKFNEGTSAGLGQIGIGAKYALVSADWFMMSPSLDILMPSPSQPQFAGPDSFTFIPRALMSAKFADQASGYLDVGYNYTVRFEQLSGFTWDAGVSANPIERFVLDAGVGGTYYAKPIKWTPDAFIQPAGSIVDRDLLLTADGDNTLGQNYIDFLFGLKVRVTEGSVINGVVRVPVNNQGFRPTAAGTVAYELYF